MLIRNKNCCTLYSSKRQTNGIYLSSHKQLNTKVSIALPSKPTLVSRIIMAAGAGEVLGVLWAVVGTPLEWDLDIKFSLPSVCPMFIDFCVLCKTVFVYVIFTNSLLF